MPPEESTCRIDILARTEHSTIGYCRRCNLFHVDLGAISLRLHVFQLHALFGDLSVALDAFKRQILVGQPAALAEAKESVH